MEKEMKFSCPQCGTELISAKVMYPQSSVEQTYPKPSLTAKERIETLSRAGVDVTNLFAMQGANGGEHIVSIKDDTLSILRDDDPIFRYIAEQGTVPNHRLHRRWVMAQMFHMLSFVPSGKCEPVGVTEMIHRLGYEYQWKMLLNELYAQMNMQDRDTTNFKDRNRWFNAKVVEAMAQDYVAKLKERIDALPEKKCKEIPYKRIGGRDIFVSDLQAKLYNPLRMASLRIGQAKNASQLYNAVKKFNDMRVRMNSETSQCKAWVDAYKGSGAFFTMQNLIRFHGCTAIDDEGNRLDKWQSLTYLSEKAEMYKNGEGWRLLAMMKKMLKDNNIDIQKKMREWRKRR